MSDDKDKRIADLEADNTLLKNAIFALLGNREAEGIIVTSKSHYTLDVWNAAQGLAKDVTQYMLHVLEISETANEINRIHAIVTGAVVVGGRGEYLEKILTSLDADSALMAHYSRLMGLLEHAPFEGLTFIVGWRDRSRAIGAEILALRNAIQACTMGHDSGAALRQLGLQSDETPFRDLIADAQAAIERLGRKRDAVAEHTGRMLAKLTSQGMSLEGARKRAIKQLEDKQHHQLGNLEFPEDEALKDLKSSSLPTLRKRKNRYAREIENGTK